MANDENLRPRELTSEKAKELGRIGGIKSGEAKRRKKNMKQALEILLELDVKNEKVKDSLRKLGITDDEMNNEMALMVAVLNKGMKGDIQALQFIRDTSGQKPVEVQEVINTPVIKDDIN